MNFLKINKKNDYKKVINALLKEKIIIISTDTIPGLLAKATFSTMNKLSIIKQSPLEKKFIVISTLKYAQKLIDKNSLSERGKSFIKKIWPSKNNPYIKTFKLWKKIFHYKKQ